VLSSITAVKKEKNPNLEHWWQYMEMFCILLFVRAQREGMWDLHLYAFQKMLPFDEGNWVVKGSSRQFNPVDGNGKIAQF